MAEENNLEFNLPPQFETITKNIKWILIGFIGLLLGSSSIFTVQPEEVGVITRFGEYQREAAPGINFKIPIMEQRIYVPCSGN